MLLAAGTPTKVVVLGIILTAVVGVAAAVAAFVSAGRDRKAQADMAAEDRRARSEEARSDRLFAARLEAYTAYSKALQTVVAVLGDSIDEPPNLPQRTRNQEAIAGFRAAHVPLALLASRPVSERLEPLSDEMNAFVDSLDSAWTGDRAAQAGARARLTAMRDRGFQLMTEAAKDLQGDDFWEAPGRR